MLFLNRPIIAQNECLTSYVYRLAEANKYPGVYHIAKLLGMSYASLSKNYFTDREILQLAKLTALPESQLLDMTTRKYAELLGPKLSTKSIHISKVKFCPLCLANNLYCPQQWFLKAVTTCDKHQVILHDNCEKCKASITIGSIMSNKCMKCNYVLMNSSAQHVQLPTWIDTSVLNIKGIGFTSCFGQTLSYESIHQLLFSSLVLLEGFPSPFSKNEPIRIFHNRKSGVQQNRNYHSAVISFFWMYDQFPKNFYKVLNHQLKLSPKTMYYRISQFENLLKHNEFEWIKLKYEQFWLKKLDEGAVRKDFSIFKKSPHLLQYRENVRKEEAKQLFSNDKILKLANENVLILSKQEDKYFVNRERLEERRLLKERYVDKNSCAHLIGVNVGIVRELIDSGILKEHVIKGDNVKRIQKEDVLKLLDNCIRSTTVIDDHLHFKEVIWRFNRLGLSVLKLVHYLQSGMIEAVSTGEIRNFKTCYLDRKQVYQVIEKLKEKRISEIGFYKEEVMKILKLGERGMRTLEITGALIPKTVIELKGGRHNRIIYDKLEVLSLTQKSG